jgi:starch synthase
VRILFVTPEVYPLAKVGGLGDVACALPKALRKLGEDVRIALPKYEWIKGEEKVADIGVDFNGHKMVSVELTRVDGVPVYLLGNDEFFGGKVIYQGGKEEVIKFAFFSRAVAELVRKLDFRPDVVHCNDWHNSLVPLHLKLLQDKTPTVFTIHNLKYQGARPGLTLSDVGVPKTASDVLEKGVVNPMKGGILYSDIVTTVSKTYAKEIKTETYGQGLHTYLRKREIHGIVNGVDYDIWGPEKDEYIYRKYGPDEPDGKAENKSRLLEEMGLPQDLETPLLGMVSRVDPHKGLDLIAEAVPKILGKEKAYFVLLGGAGEPKYQRTVERMSKKSDKIKVILRHDEKLAHKIYAGSDIFLMPSLFEPCGLGQLIALKYGTIPVVRKTGGLADTITDFDKDDKRGNGFVFERPTSVTFEHAIRRALRVYQKKEVWKKLVKRAMEADYSWERSAREYVELYNKALMERAHASGKD